MARFPRSQAPLDSEFERKAEPFGPLLPNQCSTPSATSLEASLRTTSEGTSYHRTRLVFSPYPQVKGANCTSAPFRASTKLSPGFALLRDRSSGFEPHNHDSGPFQTQRLASISWLRAFRFPYAYVLFTLKLAMIANSLARGSRRNVQPWSPCLVLTRRHDFLQQGSPLLGRTRL